LSARNVTLSKEVTNTRCWLLMSIERCELLRMAQASTEMQ